MGDIIVDLFCTRESVPKEQHQMLRHFTQCQLPDPVLKGHSQQVKVYTSEGQSNDGVKSHKAIAN